MKNYLFFNRRIVFGFFLLFTCFSLVFGQINYATISGTYSQNFDNLRSSGTSGAITGGNFNNVNTSLNGWFFAESGTGADTAYSGGTGLSTTGDTYSFGTAAADRALGGLQSGSVVPTVGFYLKNTTGQVINSVTISYVGEQWRLGATGRTDRLDFQYSTSATSLTTGTWIDVDNLDFTAPVTTGTVGSLDGNLAANRTSVSFTITGLSIANNSTIFIRWNDFNATGADDALGIDDFSLIATSNASSSLSGVTAGAGTEPATISSLINTQASSSLNFDFLVTDDANTSGGNDTLPTLISQIVIPQGAGNDIADWTQAIAGAELSDGTNTIAGTVNTINITFSGINTATLGSVSDNGTKNYTLKVWLKSTMGGTLPTTADGLNLAFKIDRSNFTTASSATSTQFESGTGTLVESGATNNEITVVATKLNFVQQPSNTAVNVSMTPAVTVSADDANGNRDLNFGSTVSVTSTGTLTGSPVAVSASSGLATFSALQHTALGTALKLTAATSGFANVDSSTFNIILVTTATDSFRSNVSTGTWAAAGSWESSSDGSNWITATAAPTSAANTITIRNGHNITLSSNVAVDQLVIENGGQLTVDQTTGVLNINDGSGFDIDIKSGGVLQVINSGTTFSYSQTVIFASNASMNVSGKVMVGNGSSTMGGGYGEFGFAAASQIIWNHNAILEWNTTGSVPATSGQTYFPGLSAATVPIFRISAISGSNLGGGSDTVINGLFQLNGTTVNWGGTGSKIFRNGVVAIGSGSMVRNASTGSWQIGDTTVAGDAEIGGSSGSLTLNNPSGISVSSVCSATLTSNATLTAGTFTNNGVLNLGTYVLSGTAGFSAALSSTLITANTGGLVSAIAVSGTKTFVAGANYVFNASTTTPFPTGTFGNPASLTFNNADVTSNRTTTLTVTGAVNINGTSKFALNSVAGNDLALGGVMTIGANASFDSNGENQINNAGGSVVVNGTFITKDAQGFSGTNATIPTITNITLNTGSTIQYALDGAQAISSRTDYKNLLFTGNGTKSSNNSITPIAGTVTVSGANTILDVSNNTFGDSGTSLTMTAGTFRLGGSGVKPDISGSYSLSAGTTIEFTGTSATQVRLAPQYANVVISGTNVVAGTTTNGGLTFRTGGTFTVKNGARFKVNNDNGFSGGSTTAIKNTNSPAITLETGSTIDYTGSDQTVTNILPYQNLNISTIGTKTASSGDLVVNNLTTVSAGTLKFLKTADNATPNVLYAHKGINNVGGSVIFENNAQLMQDEDANNTQATIQSQRDVIDMNNVSTQMDYVYWSSPVDGQNIKAFSPNTPANGYLQYNESNDKFSVTSDANFQIGKGYAIRAETGTNGYNKSYVFTGIPHNSSLDSPNLKWTDSNHGYNLIGNPYPSNINFDALFANNSSKIYSTAWFWTNNSYTAAQLGSSYNGNNYAVYNGSGGSPATYSPTSPYTGSAIPKGIVKVGQAFIVQAKSTGMNLPIGFTNTMRTTSGGNFFQKNIVKNRFWLTMTSPNTLVNTILIGYITGATNNYETDFDGELFEVGSDSFYSLLGAKKLAIQGKADIFSEDDVVGLGNVYSANGSYSIKLQDAEGLFDGSQKIYLRDKLLNKYVDMTSGQAYQFTAVKGTDNTRFEIVYKDKSVLGASDAVKSNFIVYKDGNEQVVKSDKKLGRIELFDASGKLIRSYVATSNEFRIDTSTLMNALYIIKINNSGEIRTKKFIK